MKKLLALFVLLPISCNVFTMEPLSHDREAFGAASLAPAGGSDSDCEHSEAALPPAKAPGSTHLSSQTATSDGSKSRSQQRQSPKQYIAQEVCNQTLEAAVRAASRTMINSVGIDGLLADYSASTVATICASYMKAQASNYSISANQLLTDAAAGAISQGGIQLFRCITDKASSLAEAKGWSRPQWMQKETFLGTVYDASKRTVELAVDWTIRTAITVLVRDNLGAQTFDLPQRPEGAGCSQSAQQSPETDSLSATGAVARQLAAIIGRQASNDLADV